MFDNRGLPWDQFGKDLGAAQATDAGSILNGLNLNWEVQAQPIYTGTSKDPIPGVQATVRTDSDLVLGVTSTKYKIVQNHQAFDFISDLIPQGINFVKGGEARKGSMAWLLAEAPSFKVLGEDYNSYLLFVNRHDGKGSVRVANTPIRVACSNAINLALRDASRIWSIRHSGDIDLKLREAQRTIQQAAEYQQQLSVYATNMASEKISEIQVHRFFEGLMEPPSITSDSSRAEQNTRNRYEELVTRYFEAPDLADFRGTKWGVIQALTDFQTHSAPQRKTSTFQERVFQRSANGDAWLNQAVLELEAA
jgi:phage/plasmid-like protein (TIGR03299 family)